jgi:hypothetical protein
MQAKEPPEPAAPASGIFSLPRPFAATGIAFFVGAFQMELLVAAKPTLAPWAGQVDKREAVVC